MKTFVQYSDQEKKKLKAEDIFMTIAIIILIALIFVVQIAHHDIETKWATAEAKTYKPTDNEAIYVVAYKENIDNVVKGDFESAMNHYPYMNQKERVYKKPSSIDELFGINTHYIIKKDGDTVSVGEIFNGNIIDKRKDKTKEFTVTIKKLNDDYRVILENEKDPQPQPKEITYTSDGLP